MAVRPSKLTPELSSEICRRLAEPEDETFAPQYARAREIGYHASFDLIVDVADMPRSRRRQPARCDHPGRRRGCARCLRSPAAGSRFDRCRPETDGSANFLGEAGEFAAADRRDLADAQSVAQVAGLVLQPIGGLLE